MSGMKTHKIRKLIKSSGIEEEMSKIFEQTCQGTASLADKVRDEVIEKMIPVYEELFSEEHIDAISAFYESDAGKACLANMAPLTMRSMEVAQEVMYKHFSAYNDLFEDNQDTE